MKTYFERKYDENIITTSLVDGAGTEVTPTTKNYVGFTSPETQSATINADGSLSINYYYTRNKYTINVFCVIDGIVQKNDLPIIATMRIGGENVAKNTNKISVSGYYGEMYELNILPKDGYMLTNNATISPSYNSSYNNGFAKGMISDNTRIRIVNTAEMTPK